MRLLGDVRARVTVLVLGMMLVVLLVGAAGILGVVFATGTVDRVTDEVAPAGTANAAILQDLTDMETGIRGWAITGDDEYLQPYRDGRRRLPRHEAALRELTRDEPALRDVVLEQQRVAEDWQRAYPEVRITLPAGPGTFRPDLFAAGKQRFDRIRELNAQIASTLDARITEARQGARDQLRTTVLVVALVALLGAALALFVGRVTGRGITEPLVQLRRVVDRLAAGETDARAVPHGPLETRRVAEALNEFADANQRVRALEQEVVEQLRDLDRAKSDFLSTVSHELRTPLTSIGGYVELFEDDFIGEVTPAQAGMLRVIKRNVDRLKALIEDLLTLSRAESEAFRTSFDAVDLHHVTCDVAHDLRATAAERRIVVTERYPDHPMQMLGDAGQLSRALLNLLSNAIKFSDDGTEVVIALRQDAQGCAVVEVVDTGMGIPEQELPKLATRFFRASNAVGAEITGTGLGLRIVQTIADNHGGRLEIESVEGEGTTARLVLPLRQGNIPHDAVLGRT